MRTFLSLVCFVTLSLIIAPASAAPITVGGDGNATYGGATDNAANMLIIGNQQVVVESENPGQKYALNESSFNFFAAPAGLGRTATPFVALFNGGAVNDLNNYDVIAVGDAFTVGAGQANSSLSVPFQASDGSINVANGQTVVGGFFATGSTPVGFASGAVQDARIILQGSASVVGDITLGGSNWSTNNGVNNRVYDFDINLAPQRLPEPSSLVLGLLGLSLTLLRRGRRARA